MNKINVKITKVYKPLKVTHISSVSGKFGRTSLRTEKSIEGASIKPLSNSPTMKPQIDEAYKAFFASLFKIKDKDVQRRVLQAVNGQNLTCANCASNIPTNGILQSPRSKASCYTQTLAKDFEFLERINCSTKTEPKLEPKTETKTNSSPDYILNKIQLGRAKRKFEPYAVKMEHAVTSRNSLRYNAVPDNILSKIRKIKPKIEDPPVRTVPRNCSITDKLFFDNLLDVDQSMAPHGFFDFKSDDKPTSFNDYLFVSTMEEEMRTVSNCNEEGLYTIHIAAIKSDLFKLRRILLIYKYYNWDVNIPSKEGKKESPLHYAVSVSGNKDIINLLYDNGGDVLATNDFNDTVLHLAAETIQDYRVIKRLLSKIQIDDLSKQNDRSQTILQIAASKSNRIFVKAILDFMDEKLDISSIDKDVPFHDTPEYFKELEDLHINYVKTFIKDTFVKPSIHPIKAKILDERDGRSGKTAIFLSLENNDLATCLMLMSHFADTRIPDFSNTTCIFYSTEVLKNRILAQAIYNTDSMHTSVVFKTLRHTERQRSLENRKRPQSDWNEDDDGSDIMTKVARALS